MDVHMLSDGRPALVTYTMDRHEHYSVTRTATNAEYVSHGKHDNLPVLIEELICDNNIVPTIIKTRRNLLIGQGLMAYKPRYEDGELIKDRVDMPRDLDDWLTDNVVDDYLSAAARDLYIHGLFYTEVIPNRGQTTASFRVVKPRKVRARKMKSGRIPGYLVGPFDDDIDTSSVTPVAAYDPTGALSRKCMMRCMDTLLGSDYYPCPSWYGSRNWIQLANHIPLFHLANLENSYAPRLHIEIPMEYVMIMIGPRPGGDGEKLETWKSSKESLQQQIITELDDKLQGKENAGRTVATFYFYDKEGNAHGVKIKPIDLKLNDDAMLKLFNSSNQAMTSAHATPASLAALQTEGKLSSGSDTRNQHAQYLAVHTPLDRKLILRPLREIKRKLGIAPGIEICFHDIKITTLADNKAGKEDVTL